MNEKIVRQFRLTNLGEVVFCLIIHVSLTQLMSTEEPFFRWKSSFPLNKNTANLDHFIKYNIFACLYSGLTRENNFVSVVWKLKDASANTRCMLSHWDAEHNIHFQFSIWLQTANDNVIMYTVDQHTDIKWYKETIFGTDIGCLSLRSTARVEHLCENISLLVLHKAFYAT